MSEMSFIAEAKSLFRIQEKVISDIAAQLDDNFDQAIQVLLKAKGKIIFSGIGKSGLVAKKIAATFASTGSPSFFLHAAEALHGDLGAVTKEDIIILFSYSGETEEVLNIIPYFKTEKNLIIAITKNRDSTLGRNSDIVLTTEISREICPNNLAPTSSTLAMISIGDVLASILSKSRGFNSVDFVKRHPGGSLGKKQLSTVKEVMKKKDLPLVSADEIVSNVIVRMLEGKLGLVVIVDENNQLKGIITDGDIRRGLQKYNDLVVKKASDIMTIEPLCISEEDSFLTAESLAIEKKVKSLVVADNKKQVLGIFDIFYSKV